MRSKVMKRFRTCKRQVIGQTIELDRMKQSNQKCQLIAAGHHFEVKPPTNAFRHPSGVGSQFPRIVVQKPIDFRSEALPRGGYAACRNRRKATNKGTIVVESTLGGELSMEM